MGKAAIINPYLDSMGGGERYTLSFAKVLQELGYEVCVEWKDQQIKNKLEERFGLPLKDINFISDIKKGDGYDLCFWVSDGSIPLLHARKNFIHFQVPFMDVDGRSLINKMKLFRVDKIICNSSFTKNVIDKEFGLDSLVIYPPVSIKEIKPKRKENIILYVGRFSQLTQNKRQDMLIDAFSKLNLLDWKLVLAGGVEVGVDGAMNDLINVPNKNVQIIKSPNYKTLRDLYGKAKIFWSASGFGVDEEKEPSKVEHFGMTVVEAMAGGEVPLVFDAGGHREIVNNENGYLWNNIDELVDKTNFIVSNKLIWRNLSSRAILDSKKFSYAKFRENITKIL